MFSSLFILSEVMTSRTTFPFRNFALQAYFCRTCSARHSKSREGITPYCDAGDIRAQGDSTHARTLFSRRVHRSVFCLTHALDKGSIRGKYNDGTLPRASTFSARYFRSETILTRLALHLLEVRLRYWTSSCLQSQSSYLTNYYNLSTKYL